MRLRDRYALEMHAVMARGMEEDAIGRTV